MQARDLYKKSKIIKIRSIAQKLQPVKLKTSVDEIGKIVGGEWFCSLKHNNVTKLRTNETKQNERTDNDF